MARALKEAFEGTAVVLTPDLPLHPKEALKEIRSIIDREQPDLLLGNSCGSFLAQMLAPVVGIPALLGNPYFMMTEFLKERIGEHEYKAPRRDGNQRLVIDEALIEEFAELEAVQFDHCNPYYKDRVWGLLVSRTPWLTSLLSSSSTTTKPSISLAVIRLLSRR
ncbi:MAG: YqiA/YcfP family alpha/beta fold hydrolase [Segatella copri]